MHNKHMQGEALITFLFFVTIGIMIISAVAVILFVNELSASTVETGTDAYYVAESGMENALLTLLRNPSYTGETIAVGGGVATVTVSNLNQNTLIATATGSFANTIRKIEVQTVYNNATYTITSWKEK